jgi:ribose transport system ATP-binding protein
MTQAAVPEPASSPFLLDARRITKSFGPTKVLRGLDFAVAPGEIHALLGGNGAGKSTLLKIVSGVTARDGGTLLYEGRDIDGQEGREARSRGIAVVHQELAVLPHLTAAENIALPHHRRGLSLFSQRAAHRTALAALALIDRGFAERAAGVRVGDLTLHEQQLVEIARALDSGAQLLLLDEPTANLTATETERLFEVVRRLARESGIAVVFVSHRMREIRQIADVCTIIRDGVTAVDRQPLGALTDADIVDKMGQASAVSATGGRPLARAANSSAGTGRGRLEVMGLGLDVAVEGGSILGLAGAPAGPEALIGALIGAGHAGPLVVRLDGREHGYRTPRQAARSMVGFVSGDRAGKGILASLPIIDNMLASRRVAHGQVLVPRSEAAEAGSLLAALRIKAGSLWDLPATLSGGTQQKLLIARWLNLGPTMLVLEEPTRGVDIGTKREIYALIRTMAAAGTTVVWWSTEQTELIELCDTVLAFDPDGRPTSILRREEITEDNLAAATGMAA